MLSRHGGHHVAQKSKIKILSFMVSFVICFPEIVCIFSSVICFFWMRKELFDGGCVVSVLLDEASCLNKSPMLIPIKMVIKRIITFRSGIKDLLYC